MLLRRVAKHLDDQNWLAVGLDLLVVMIGVVLGFQITQWNESRQQSVREDAALVRLHEEVFAVVSYLETRVNSFEELIADQDTAIGSLANGSWPQVDRRILETALSSRLFYPAITPPRSVYDELVGSGEFADLSNAHVRTSVAAYYSELEFVHGQLEYFRDDMQSVSQFLRENNAVLAVYDADSVQRMGVRYDFAMLADNPFYLGAFVGSLRNQIVFQSYRRRLLERAAAMLAAIETSTPSP